MIKNIIGSIFLIACAISLLISLLGVFKFKYVMNRMHSAAIIDGAGMLLLIIGLIFFADSIDYVFKLILVLVFQWVGSPIASHIVTRMEIEADKDASKHMKRGK